MYNIKYVENELFFSQIKKSLEAGEKVRFEVKGYSMYPLLRNEGDEVLLKPLSNKEEVQKGDILLFHFQGKYILHRVIGRSNGNFLLRGDNVFGSVEECREEDIIGVVEEIYRRKKKKGLPLFSIVSPRSLMWKMIVGVRRGIVIMIKSKIGKKLVRKN